jgi:hypothetical protein
MWFGFIWLRTGTSGGLLRTRWWTYKSYVKGFSRTTRHYGVNSVKVTTVTTWSRRDVLVHLSGSQLVGLGGRYWSARPPNAASTVPSTSRHRNQNNLTKSLKVTDLFNTAFFTSQKKKSAVAGTASDLEQWYSTGGTRTPGGKRRHLRG